MNGLKVVTVLADIMTVLAAVAIGVPRVLGVKSEAYQASAHLVVGILIGEAITGKSPRRQCLCAALAAILSAIEVIFFPRL